MNQEDVVHIHDGILFGNKKEVLIFSITWMIPEVIIMLSEIRDRNTT